MTSKELLLVTIFALCSSGTAGWAGGPHADIKGNWLGVVNLNGSQTRIFVGIDEPTPGNFTGGANNFEDGTLDQSPISITYAAPNVALGFGPILGLASSSGFQGTVNPLRTEMSGQWIQGSQSVPMTFEREPDVDDFVPGLYVDPAWGPLPYRLFIPSNYVATVKYPLMLSLHDAYASGVDNLSQISNQTTELAFVYHESQAKYPCFLLAPQTPNSWEFHQLKGLLDYVLPQYSIDPDRLYVMGYSLGGEEIWELLLNYPNLFAAAVPMSGPDIVNQPFGAVTNVAVWEFDSTSDTGWVQGTRGVLTAFRNAGGRPVYTEYATGGHYLFWPASGNKPGLVDWVMSLRRGVRSDVGPFLKILGPTAARTYFTTAPTISLSGVGAVYTQGSYRVQWQNTRGGFGIGQATNDWVFAAVPVQPGTNVLTVMGSEPSGQPGFGGGTSFSENLTVIRMARIVASVYTDGAGAHLSWTGGLAPFTVEQSTNLALGGWAPVFTTGALHAQLPLTNSQAFYRIRSQ